MRAEILTIGDELCRGEIVDTNSSYLAARLWDLGITARWMTSCTDDEADIELAVATAVRRADVVVCSGGLGPTEDDLTVEVVAKLVGSDVEIEEAARARMEAWFAGRVEVTPIQLRQVRVPAGARVHPNPVGLAPAFEVAVRGVPVICMPGVPRELHAIVDQGLEARLRELRDARPDREHVARQIYRVFGRGESQISQACRGLVDGVAGATIHYQVKFPETLVKLVVRDIDRAQAAARLAELDGAVRGRLAPQLYGTGDESLVERVMRRLLEAKRTVVTAESCTGGMVGEMLTRMPGSSNAFLGGAITYTNSEKMRQLGVQEATLEAFGAVSEQTATEMARGARERFDADHAVSITGVAGPDGGSKEKPVGTVWLGLASRGVERIATRKLAWPSTRDQVRTLSAWWALAMIDAAIPSTDPVEQARATWVLEPRTSDPERPGGSGEKVVVSDHKRLFVGARVSVATASSLAGAAETLARRARDAGIDIRWVAPTNYHVTLAFLGNTRIDAIPALHDALVAATAGTPQLKLRTGRIGAFPSIDKARVVWAGVEDLDRTPLAALAKRVQDGLATLGFGALLAEAKKPFHAHVTLGRVRETRPLKEVVLPLAEQMFGDTRIDAISLFESETKSSGSAYRELLKFSFKSAEDRPETAVERQTRALDVGERELETDDGWPRGHRTD